MRYGRSNLPHPRGRRARTNATGGVPLQCPRPAPGTPVVPRLHPAHLLFDPFLRALPCGRNAFLFFGKTDLAIESPRFQTNRYRVRSLQNGPNQHLFLVLGSQTVSAVLPCADLMLEFFLHICFPNKYFSADEDVEGVSPSTPEGGLFPSSPSFGAGASPGSPAPHPSPARVFLKARKLGSPPPLLNNEVEAGADQQSHQPPSRAS